MNLKKMAISAIAALAIGSTVASAAPVQVENDGSGDYLIAPVYYAIDNWQTELKVVNTNPTKAIVAKVVIRDALNSTEFMDFPIYLTPGDVWTGTLKVSNGNVVVESSDDSMMLGFNSNGGPQRQGSVNNPIIIDNSASADPAKGSNWYGYVEIFGLAAYDAATIDPTWRVNKPLDKVKFYKAVRNPANPLGLNAVNAEDVDNDSLIGKETIYANVTIDKNKRAMTLNLYALGNVAETARVEGVIGTNTFLPGSESAKPTVVEEMDRALAKSHIYVMYEGDGTAINPMVTHFTVPTKKYHIMNKYTQLDQKGYTVFNGQWIYKINTMTTIFRNNSEEAKYCSSTLDDISGNIDSQCNDIPIPEEIHRFSFGDNYISSYSFKEGGYIDFDLTSNTIKFTELDHENIHGMPVIPVTFTSTKIGEFTIHSALYNQYQAAQ